jgi:hypothetical protein
MMILTITVKLIAPVDPTITPVKRTASGNANLRPTNLSAVDHDPTGTMMINGHEHLVWVPQQGSVSVGFHTTLTQAPGISVPVTSTAGGGGTLMPCWTPYGMR